MDIPAPQSNEKNIYDFGFDPNLSRAIADKSTGVVYDAVGDSLNTAQLLQGGNLTLKTLSVGNLVRQVAPGDDLQAAIEAVSREGGGAVQLLAKKYSMTKSIDLRSNVTLLGAGSATTILDFNGTAFQLRAVGSDAYNTGTVAISNDGLTVTGTGTTWTASMIGRSILLEDFWYVIQNVTSTTSITLASQYDGSTLSGSAYMIANTVNNITVKGVSLQNSTASLFKAQYVNSLTTDDVVYISGLIGLDGDDSSLINILNSAAIACGTGMTFDNFFFGTFFNNNILESTSGGALVCNTVRNWCIDVFSFQNNTGDALSFTNSSNNDVLDFSIQQTTGIGINFISGNSDIGVTSGVIKNSSSDGIKLTATTDACGFTGLQIHNNTGYGINIAASTCDNNIVVANYFSTNTAGNMNDSGTSTIIRSNSGVSDNSTTTAGTRQVFTSNGTYTKPTGVRFIDVEVQGPGGAGTGVNNGTGRGVNGGSGGGYVKKRLTTSQLGTTETVVVGTGGAGTAAGAGGNGSADSTFTYNSGGNTLTAGKGNGGAVAIGNAAGGAATGGDVNIPGGEGGAALGNYPSGIGGDSQLGRGGASVGTASTNGRAGVGYGSGGSGAYDSSGVNQTGGAGANGIVIVDEYY